MAAINPILAQKLGLTPAPTAAQDAEPATPMRQMWRALGRAADKAVGLSVSVLGIS
jgi:flagellar motor switch protein FliM